MYMKKQFLTLMATISVLLLTGCDTLPEPLRELEDRTSIEQAIVEIELDGGVEDAVEPIQLPNTTPLFERTNFVQYNSTYKLSAEVPHKWEIEYVPQNNSINIYDLAAEGDTLRDKSQILILSRIGNTFEIPKGLEVVTQEEKLISGHEAKEYVVKPLEGIASFDHEPSWRATEHRMITVRYSIEENSAFFTFAQSKGMTNEAFDQFIASVQFYNDSSSFVDAIDRAKERANKKPFGVYITPQNSPIENEKFTGYHTGTDFEIFEDEFTKNVPIYAICGGTVKHAGPIEGYGGVVVQECSLDGEPITVLYGHISPGGTARVGQYLAPGDPVAELAADHSVEAGSERKHLHLGIHKGTDIEFRGYAASEDQLDMFIDPCSIICKD